MNRGSIGDLSKAISMFSPEDINRILQAISQDAKCQNKLKEIEDALYRAVDQTMDEKGEQVVKTAAYISAYLFKKKNELFILVIKDEASVTAGAFFDAKICVVVIWQTGSCQEVQYVIEHNIL